MTGIREHLMSTVLTACESGDAIWVGEAEEVVEALMSQYYIVRKPVDSEKEKS